MKKAELIFNIISIPVDALMLLLAGVASFYLRLQPTVVAKFPLTFRLRIHDFLTVSLNVIPVLLLIFAFVGLYNLRGTRKFVTELNRIVIATSLGLLLIILLFFFNRNFNQNIFPSRFIILSAWGLGIVFVVAGRLLLGAVQRIFFRRGIGLHKLAIINGNQDAGIIEQVYKNKTYGYEIVRELAYGPQAIAALEDLHRQRQIDEILQANPNLSDDANLQLVQFARSRGLKFSFVPNLFEVQRNVIETDQLNGVPVISLKNTPLDGWGKVAKRILDVSVSAVCLAATSPLFILIAVAIKLDSRGKVIYSAARVGDRGDFMCYKFRSMYSHMSVGDGYGGRGAEMLRRQLWEKNDRGGKDGPFLKIKHDPRVTRAGRFLRRTKLDELPQFWNVLVGNMSMVGPRAHVLDEVQRYRDSYARMFSIKPGVFGLSQISQLGLPDLPFGEEIRLNTFYIENWSLWLDVKILAQSFWLLLFGKKPKEDY